MRWVKWNFSPLLFWRILEIHLLHVKDVFNHRDGTGEDHVAFISFIEGEDDESTIHIPSGEQPQSFAYRTNNLYGPGFTFVCPGVSPPQSRLVRCRRDDNRKRFLRGYGGKNLCLHPPVACDHACCLDLQHACFGPGKALASGLLIPASCHCHPLWDLVGECSVSAEYIRGHVHCVVHSAQHWCRLACKLVPKKARQGKRVATTGVLAPLSSHRWGQNTNRQFTFCYNDR